MNEGKFYVTIDGTNYLRQLAPFVNYLKQQQTGSVVTLEVSHIHSADSAVKPQALPAHGTGNHE